MIDVCPFCLSRVLFKDDGTCPQCKNNRNNPPSQLEIENHIKRKNKVQNQKLQAQLKDFKRKYIFFRLIPALLLFIIGMTFSFLIKTGFIWIGFIVSGFVYFTFGCVDYFYKVKEIKFEIKSHISQTDS